MKDFFGVTIEVGDRVAYNPPYYKGLASGYVKKINNILLRVAQGRGTNEPTNVHPNNVVVDVGYRTE